MYFASLTKITSDEETISVDHTSKFKVIQSMVSPPFIVYNTENGVEPHILNYQINRKFQEKIVDVIVGNVETFSETFRVD